MFKINTDGTDYTVLKHCTDASYYGYEPYAGVALSGNTLYGTTYRGGRWFSGTLFRVNTDGTGYTVLRHLNWSSGEGYPEAGLTVSGSTLYGTTSGGNSDYDLGTVFKVNTDGTGYTVLKRFFGNVFPHGDGRNPRCLTLSGNTLYGTTREGGSSDKGTVFSIDLPRPPIADASATPTMVISPNGTNASVVLDGSRSSDPDGDPLEYAWHSMPDAGHWTQVATGVVAAIKLPVGVNEIALVVDDGMAQDTNTLTVTVLTTAQAVQGLIAHVNKSDLPHKRPLLASLEAALASIERGNHNSATGQLGAFMNKVGAQVGDANLARALVQKAAQVIHELGGDGSATVAVRIHSLKRHPNGNMQMKINGEAGQAYILEASTNLVDWEAICVVQPGADGQCEFEDQAAATLPCRFYRLLEIAGDTR